MSSKAHASLGENGDDVCEGHEKPILGIGNVLSKSIIMQVGAEKLKGVGIQNFERQSLICHFASLLL